MKYKKAQLEQLQGIILVLIVTGILLVVGFLIFAETQEQVIDLMTTSTATNESYAYVDSTLAALTHSPGAVTLSCSALYNDTANTVVIGSGNYTCNVSGLKVVADQTFNETLFVTYTYKTADYAYNASSEVTGATEDVPGWLPIIVVVLIGAVLIGLVSFLRRQT